MSLVPCQWGIDEWPGLVDVVQTAGLPSLQRLRAVSGPVSTGRNGSWHGLYTQNRRLYSGAWNDAGVCDDTWLLSTNTIAGDWNHVRVTCDDSVAGEIKLHANGATALTGTVSALGSHN